MKKIIYLLAAAVMMTAPGCKKIAEVADISFDAPYSQKATIPSDPAHPYGVPLAAGGLDMDFISPSMATGSQEYFDEYHVSGKNIKSTTMESGKLTMTSATTNFDYLDKVEVYVSTESLPEVLVAYQDNIPKGQNSITLLSTGVNLRKYVKADLVNGHVKVHVNTIPADGSTLNVAAEFHLVANALVNYDK